MFLVTCLLRKVWKMDGPYYISSIVGIQLGLLRVWPRRTDLQIFTGWVGLSLGQCPDGSSGPSVLWDGGCTLGGSNLHLTQPRAHLIWSDTVLVTIRPSRWKSVNLFLSSPSSIPTIVILKQFDNLTPWFPMEIEYQQGGHDTCSSQTTPALIGGDN